MKGIFFSVLLCYVVALKGVSQTEVRPLPPNINRPSINLFAPFISGDGKTIVFLSDYTDDGYHGMRWATKKTVSTWNDGLEVNKLINRATLNFRGGYSLSFDGDLMIFTSRKSGLGGFDLWYSNRRGDDWEAPKNFGKPINSSTNDGCGMLSPDGEYLYFMRCDQMEAYQGASGCKLMVAKKTYNGWEEPVPLPDNINTGNSQVPRILADGETLIFSSDQMGGKGGFDLFMSRKEGDGWSDPVPMDFINTEKDDQFISIPAKGRYMYAEIDGIKDREIAEILIPEEFQPSKVMRIRGKVTDGVTNEPLNANLTVFNVDMRDRLWNEKVGKKGEFAIVLKEGSVYDVSLDVENKGYMYFSKIYDLKEVGSRDKEILNISLEPMKAGSQYPLDVLFEENSAVLDEDGVFELRRVADLLRKNGEMKVEIEVVSNNYQEDSVASEMLTEVKMDTTYEAHSNTKASMDTVQSINTAKVGIEERDSLEMDDHEPAFRLIKIYHNDRSEKQAEAIKTYIEGRGVKEDRIKLKWSKEEKGEAGKPISVKMKILTL
ncbi:TolB-like translocation protein [Fulvivirga sediminis]|uniref:PD40 domain-containing protein n=1 Tax=Fulvivirga sediminis TaxID=2803949 RepID=A0A937F5L0_9BACT|nr:PD40 domain-containing protein [Fulvivirga sediminis]MBL3654679.1 PD40 domain-containing protein [Fulvivirga sediminis]